MKWSRKIKLGLTVTNGVVEPTGGGTTGPTVIPEPKILVSNIKITDLPSSELAKLTILNLPQQVQADLAKEKERLRYLSSVEGGINQMLRTSAWLDIQFNESGVPIRSGLGSISNLPDEVHPQRGWVTLWNHSYSWRYNTTDKRVSFRYYISSDRASYLLWFDGDVKDLFVSMGTSPWRRNGLISVWRLVSA